MAILVGMISILLLLQAYGYTYNFRTGNISQNGLLFVDAHPLPATLALNGENNGLTDKRLVLKEGEYDISLQRDGYHAWEHSIVMKGGVIERFLYPFLFPVNIESNDAELYTSQTSFVTQSPDRQWLVLRSPGSIAQFEVINTGQEQITPETFQLPEAVMTLTGEKHTIDLVEWSTNNRHFVVKHSHDGGSEYILIDRDDPSLSQNLSKTIEVPFSTLSLRDKKFDSYYLYLATDKSLKRYDLATAQSSSVASDVIAYHSHGDDELLYVADAANPKSKTVPLRMIDNGEAYTIRELPRSNKYLLDMAQYEGDWYLVASPSEEDKVYVFLNPTEILRKNKEAKIIPKAVLKMVNATSVSFSQNARIIATQSGSKVAVYDAEQKKTYHYDTSIPLGSSSEFEWMDGHRLTAISNKKQHVFDFDGTNVRQLGDAYNNSQPFFDRDYTAVFTLAPSLDVEGRSALQRTELIVEADR